MSQKHSLSKTTQYVAKALTGYNLSYGFSRLISTGMDGMPDAAILQIAGFEIIVGLICGAVLIFPR
jgi:hypothetical protein